jgi:hypothetical protein
LNLSGFNCIELFTCNGVHSSFTTCAVGAVSEDSEGCDLEDLEPSVEDFSVPTTEGEAGRVDLLFGCAFSVL